MRSMENKILLDTNAILRFLLDDLHEQYEMTKQAIEDSDCILILPVVQEAVYVLEGYYNVPRDRIVQSFIDLKDAVMIEDEDVCLKAFEYYTEQPKLDFADCILCGYHSVRKIDVLTFDRKLRKKMEGKSE